MEIGLKVRKAFARLTRQYGLGKVEFDQSLMAKLAIKEQRLHAHLPIFWFRRDSVVTRLTGLAKRPCRLVDRYFCHFTCATRFEIVYTGVITSAQLKKIESEDVQSCQAVSIMLGARHMIAKCWNIREAVNRRHLAARDMTLGCGVRTLVAEQGSGPETNGCSGLAGANMSVGPVSR